MLAWQSLAIVVGALLVVLSLTDVFQSVVVPRAPAGRRLRPSFYSARAAWWLWPHLSWWLHPRNPDRREDFLAIFAPFNLILTLMLWSLLMLLGYGAIFFAMRENVRPELVTFPEAFYFAGTSFFTIGFGDYVGSSGWTRLIALAAGASGFGVISTTTAYLFAIFGAFQAREQFVVTLGARAGSPPSGVGFLEIAQLTKTTGSLSPIMRDAQQWAATLMETHLAYPILAYFRSSHDYESWVGTLGTLLDASTILLSTVVDFDGEAKVFHTIGRHATHDLARYFHLASEDRNAGVTFEEFNEACERLERCGYTLRERREAWERFTTLRGAYATNLNALARFFQTPPLRWIGDRSILTLPH
ncbi:MAG TPA: potassium channel family protein [Candidatus Baltobacteraceae bacterium]|nr:potassium channel family protein [Candidatus Baltobacteraceae bacterium]